MRSTFLILFLLIIIHFQSKSQGYAIGADLVQAGINGVLAGHYCF